MLVLRLDTADAGGAALWTTRMALFFRDVVVQPGLPPLGQDLPAELSNQDVVARIPLPTGPADAHLYTEAAQIWNPIHTDLAVARGRRPGRANPARNRYPCAGRHLRREVVSMQRQ